MKNIALAASLATTLAAIAPMAQADPAVGFGLSYVFGGNTGGDVAVGARVFSDDTKQNAVASLGLDYKINSGSWRPNVGAAWLDNNVYGDLSIGYDLGARGIDFGAGLGGWSKF
ncbi:hypothetical protein U5922_003635 [Aquicoccus sp. G2-2]|jgi:hypothetical protein|uniref:hypothetical protein n=1 Tax=Aquicoccus sp. G2-2 TaxID=3092120 RepID=UPI002ADF5501|nr:hypothetical protein [Aquicoccus sp. G2-2]MEA1112606.1 hypothetical protein [Aquicoccus sp. G2-2]